MLRVHDAHWTNCTVKKEAVWLSFFEGISCRKFEFMASYNEFTTYLTFCNYCVKEIIIAEGTRWTEVSELYSQERYCVAFILCEFMASCYEVSTYLIQCVPPKTFKI